MGRRVCLRIDGIFRDGDIAVGGRMIGFGMKSISVIKDNIHQLGLWFNIVHITGMRHSSDIFGHHKKIKNKIKIMFGSRGPNDVERSTLVGPLHAGLVYLGLRSGRQPQNFNGL